jgi:hypothetical protein
MWTAKNHGRCDRRKVRYPTVLTDNEWANVGPVIPPAKRGGNKRRVDHIERGTTLPRYFAFSCQSPIAAPAGSMMMEKEPAPITSVTSLQTVAPSDFALAVAAATSSTST